VGIPNIKVARPEIHAYHDYRKFLADYFLFLKSVDHDFSVNRLAEISDIASGYIHSVLKGTLRFSEKSLDKVLPHLHLSVSEQKYFRLLCVLSDSESEPEKVKAFQKIQKARGYKKLNPREVEVFRYLSKWYCVAIREMAALEDFSTDVEWIQKRLAFPVTETEIKDALKFLIDHGFLELHINGKVRIPNKRLDCVDEIFSLALAQYHRQTLTMAADSLSLFDGGKRSVTGYVIAISKERFNEVKKRLDEALKDIIEIAERDEKPDSVYQVSFIGFPLAREDDRS
jgi:uncharacterized protein (TIGR02147 family)